MACMNQLEAFLIENNNEPFFIQKQMGKHMSKWVLYPSMEYEETMTMMTKDGKRFVKTEKKKSVVSIEGFNQIQILPSWVVFDIDPPKTTIARDREEAADKQAKILLERLEEAGIGYEHFTSGNTGRHIVIRFEELGEYSPADRLFLKREIIKMYASGLDIDLQKCGSKTTIQMPYTRHRKTGKMKDLISSKDGTSATIPRKALKSLSYHKVGLYMAQLTKKENKPSSELPTSLCIKAFEDTLIPEGNRHNVLFCLIGYWKENLSEEELFIKAKEWSDKNNNVHSDYELIQMVKKEKQSNRKPGCQYLKNVLRDANIKEPCEGCGMNG
jgi:hypothetical protein